MSARNAPRCFARTLIASAALVVGVLAAAPSATADEATDAPETVNDTLAIDGGGFGRVDVLKNDTDPNGDELAVCRVDVPDDVPLFVDNLDGLLYIGAARNRSATYEITYYACDFDYLTPATVTVTVTRIPPVEASKIAGHPGRVKFTNSGEKKIVVLYGSRREPRPDGRVALPAHTSAAISTKRTSLFYLGFVPSTGTFAGQGTVRNIAQPEKVAAERPSVSSHSKRELREWRSTL